MFSDAKKKHFRILKISKKSQARLGILKTKSANLLTPFFMPVATQGTIKQTSVFELSKLDTNILLSNTYHLMLRPGADLIKKQGGLHKFINWDKAILTDSGGFQVFSLAQGRNKSGKSLVKLTNDGVYFKSYIDGSKHYLSPEKSLQIQMDLGVDIAVCLDECVALPASEKYIAKSVDLTSAWAKRSKEYLAKSKKKNKPLLFAVIQGGLNKDLRLKSLADLTKIGFDGYNIGGLSVGESAEEMYQTLDYLTPQMPKDKTRYLMGVGYPENILEAVKRGVDMFDCVIPSREGRHGRLFVFSSQKGFAYKTINILKSEFKNNKTSINKDSSILELRKFSKAYLHYLFKIKEPLASRLASLNNLEFYLRFMNRIRQAIKEGNL